jgi:hypothetical protein
MKIFFDFQVLTLVKYPVDKLQTQDLIHFLSVGLLSSSFVQY